MLVLDLFESTFVGRPPLIASLRFAATYPGWTQVTSPITIWACNERTSVSARLAPPVTICVLFGCRGFGPTFHTGLNVQLH